MGSNFSENKVQVVFKCEIKTSHFLLHSVAHEEQVREVPLQSIQSPQIKWTIHALQLLKARK